MYRVVLEHLVMMLQTFENNAFPLEQVQVQMLTFLTTVVQFD
jgi:hypothetical protein